MVVILSVPTPIPQPETPPALVLVRVRDSLVIEPSATDGYDSARESGNLVHPILGKPEPDVTIRPAKMRTGTLTYWFDDEAESRAAEQAHSTGDIFTLIYGHRPTIEMSYVPSGVIARRLDKSSAWIVTVDFTEVAAT